MCAIMFDPDVYLRILKLNSKFVKGLFQVKLNTNKAQ